MTDQPTRFQSQLTLQPVVPPRPKLPPEKHAQVKRAAEAQIDNFLRQVGITDPAAATDPEGRRYFSRGPVEGRVYVTESDADLFLRTEAVVMQLPSDKELLLPLMRELLEFNAHVSGLARLGIERDWIFASSIQPVLELRGDDFAQIINAVMQLAGERFDKLIEKYGGTTKPRRSFDQAKEQAGNNPSAGGAAGDTAYLLQLGKTHFEAAEYNRALTVFEQVLSVDGKHAEAQAYRAQCLNCLGQFALAFSAAGEALRVNPDLALAYVARGVALLRQGNPKGGQAELDKAIQLDAKQARAYLARGECHEALRELNAAIADFTQAISSTSERDVLALAHNHLGLCHREQNQLATALKDFDEALKIYPDSPLFLGNRGITYHAQGELARALFDLSEAIRLAQHNAYYLFRRGLVYLDKQDPTNALEDFTEASHVDPEYALAYVESARAWWMLGDIQQAVKICSQAIQIKPNEPDAYYLRASIRRSQKDYWMAISDLDQVIRLAPQWADAYQTGHLPPVEP